MRAVRGLDQRRNGKTIGLCVSGGIDSEVLARSLYEYGVPFEMYFLDIWGLNRKAFEDWGPVLKRETGKPIREVRIERSDFYGSIGPGLFRQFGIEYPTYLSMTYLFEQIPTSQFILTGDGDFHRTGKLMESIGYQSDFKGGESCWLPFPSSSVFYYLWAQDRNRDGEFSFFCSTPGLVSSMLKHPQFQWRFPFSDTRDVIYAEFPEIARREKTTNWDTRLAKRENVLVRSWLVKCVEHLEEFAYWRPSIGTNVRLDNWGAKGQFEYDHEL